MPKSTKPKAAKTKIFQFRAQIAPRVYRDIEIEGKNNLADLAEAILAAYEFDNDHSYGFYNNLKRIYDSKEIYELFEDMEKGSGSPGARGVYGTKIDKVFVPEKQMQFHYDYGDDWQFILTCQGIAPPKPGISYPRSAGGKGDAPEQYPSNEEEEIA